jgi:hypothetical protein
MPAPEINIGDRVWVDASDIKMTCPSPKFSDKWLGPFKVVKAVGNGVYKLELPPCYSQLHSVFPVVKLELAKTDPFPERPWNDEPPPPLSSGWTETRGGRSTRSFEARVQYGSLWYMVRWKGYGPEHNKWVKHSDVFAKDAIDAYCHRYPNAPRQIASAAFDSLSFRMCDRTIHFIHQDTVFQGEGLMSGEPPLQPLQMVFHPDLIQMLWALWTLLHPDWLQILWMVFRLVLWILLHPSIWPPNHPRHLSALAGTCCATRPAIIVDTSRHVLLGSYQSVYKVSPGMGILILSSLRIPPLGA